MKINKKGFSLIELMATIVILTIIGTIAVVSYNSYYDKSKIKVYKNYEESMQEAAMEYIMDTGDMPTTADSMKIPLKFFVGKDTYNGHIANPPYLTEFKSPNGKDDKCLSSSYVLVKMNEDKVTTDGKIDHNKSLIYKICLKCDNYESTGCKTQKYMRTRICKMYHKCLVDGELVWSSKCGCQIYGDWSSWSQVTNCTVDQHIVDPYTECKDE